MIGFPVGLDPALCLFEAELAGVDGLTGGDNSWDRAEACADTGAGGVDPGGQCLLEHRWIEFPLLPVRIAEGAGEAGGEQGGAQARSGGEELIDEAILTAAEAERIQPGRGDEIRRIITAGVRGGDDQRNGLAQRVVNRNGAKLGLRGDRNVHAAIEAGSDANVTRLIAISGHDCLAKPIVGARRAGRRST